MPELKAIANAATLSDSSCERRRRTGCCGTGKCARIAAVPPQRDDRLVTRPECVRTLIVDTLIGSVPGHCRPLRRVGEPIPNGLARCAVVARERGEIYLLERWPAPLVRGRRAWPVSDAVGVRSPFVADVRRGWCAVAAL